MIFTILMFYCIDKIERERKEIFLLNPMKEIAINPNGWELILYGDDKISLKVIPKSKIF